MQNEQLVQTRSKDNKLTYASVKDFVIRTKDLLRIQEEQEAALFRQMTKNKSISELQNQGYGLGNMTIVSVKRGYYGKTILTLTKAYHSDKNPQIIPEQCKIQVGDDVALFKNNNVVTDGVVYKRIGPKIQISTRSQIDQQNDFEGINCNIVLKWNEVTFRRYHKALEQLQNSQSPLIQIFFPPQKSNDNRKRIIQMEYKNQKLNSQQIEAVKHCIKDKVHLLHGPPGTGKTTTVCQLIIQAVHRKEKVLACGPSNISVDNIVEGLSGQVKVIRIGNPARMIENVLERCLDVQVAKQSGLWKGQVKKLQAMKKKLGKATKQERRQISAQIRQLRDQIYHLQEQVIQQILNDTQVICCTNAGAADRVFRRYLPKRIFDLVVIDQCGQSLEVACWIPMLKGRRIVLAGDHKQLPPTIQNNQNSLLGYTLFSRAMEQLTDISSTMLKTQYRMNSNIMGWSNQQFYNNQLRAHQSVATHTLRDLYSTVEEQKQTLLFVDTTGCGMGQDGEVNQSKFNVGEADIILSIYKKLLKYDVSSKHIAILTPYSKQVSLIKSLVIKAELPTPDVSTVDGIQGRQKQCVMISLVRSNARNDIGFLKDWRRMNVAVTRARRMLIIVGNAECVSADQHIANLVKWIQERGDMWSAQTFRDDQNIRFGLGVSDKKVFQAAKEQKQEKSKPQQSVKKKQNKKKQQKQTQSKHQQHTQQQQKAVKEHFRKVFQQILRQLTINHATAFERKMIHQLAQEMGLCHETSPDKKYIKVWKKLTDDEVTQKYVELQKLKQQQDQLEEKKKQKQRRKKEKRQLKKEGPQPIHSNSTSFSQAMKNLIAEESSEEEQKQKKEEKTEQQKKAQIKSEQLSKKAKKMKKQKQMQQKKQQDELRQQQELKKLMLQKPKQNECNKCNKKITSVTAAQCKYCHLKYCRYHVLAEEHGCDDYANAQARKPKDFDKRIEAATQKMKQHIKKQEESRRKGNKKK